MRQHSVGVGIWEAEPRIKGASISLRTGRNGGHQALHEPVVPQSDRADPAPSNNRIGAGDFPANGELRRVCGKDHPRQIRIDERHRNAAPILSIASGGDANPSRRSGILIRLQWSGAWIMCAARRNEEHERTASQHACARAYPRQSPSKSCHLFHAVIIGSIRLLP